MKTNRKTGKRMARSLMMSRTEMSRSKSKLGLQYPEKYPIVQVIFQIRTWHCSVLHADKSSIDSTPLPHSLSSMSSNPETAFYGQSALSKKQSCRCKHTFH